MGKCCWQDNPLQLQKGQTFLPLTPKRELCLFWSQGLRLCTSHSSAPGLKRTSDSIMLSQNKRSWGLPSTETFSCNQIDLIWDGGRIPSTLFAYRNLQTCWELLFFSGFHMISQLTYFLNNLVQQILFLHTERAKCSLYIFAIAYLSLKM